MHEDLLGYLLGALEPHEMRRIDQWLREDADARRQLEDVRRMLEPLDESSGTIELPPPDLISRTMAQLPPMELPPAAASSVHDAAAPTVSMQANLDPPRSVGWTWMDWAASSAAAAILLALMLPAIAEGRFEARKNACQDQLRQLGTALTQFVTRNESGRLPAVAGSGPEAFAGIYAIRLRDAGLLDDPTLRWCPSLDAPAATAGPAAKTTLISVNQLHRSTVDQLRQIQRHAGGHYAYTLGVIEREHFASPRFESRSSFAVMSDAPMPFDAAAPLTRSVGHSGIGMNVLFEDGRVQFLPMASLNEIPDHPLMNHRQQTEAGVNIDDASLAPSWRPPFVDVQQR